MSEDVIAVSRPVATASPGSRALTISAWSWIGYEATRIPYLVLLKIYIFAPYVSKVMIGDPVLGQTLFARYGFVAGLVGAVTVPFLGASLDRMGPRKPWITACILISLPLLVGLWWAKPDRSGLSVAAVLMIVMALNLLFVYSEILHNAMLGPAVGMSRVGRYSGISLGVANLVSVSIMMFLLWGFALPGQLHWFGIPDQPLFGFSQASHEMERLIGPLIAALACAGLFMLLRFTIDAPASGETFVRAVRLGSRDVFALIAGLRQQPNLLKFLVARTFYADGFHTLIIFEGIYASGVMEWHGFKLLSFAVVKIAFAALGGLLAASLNVRLGTRRAIIVQISMTVVLLVMVLGTTPDRMIFFWPHDPAAPALWSGPVFRTLPEVAFMLLSGSMTAFAVASIASGRAMIIQIVPPMRVGAYFGLFGLTASTTVWIAPMLVGILTARFQSQAVGLVPIAVLLTLGAIGMLLVKGGDRLEA
ncbi:MULTISPECIES: MFS transporter [Bradyrhizobium]|uniref:MFS transporter n=1 Tax=Bradyrhizobium elkanii TaxID=29448 RepID=A0A4U6S694_BRAEL|nr:MULTISPECIES: MFS transporter [Bradyrhizobium]MTV18887.1 MFS transporter [Bradyrhizobium sp. BR2003]TKV83269.1 MFS transporter [Bradyrhizobium elkanii]